MELHGFCEPGFEPVRDAFVANFERGAEVGACCAVTRNGEPVVDLWAGDAIQGQAPWREDTIVNVYSTTKTMAAITMLVLADRGLLDFEAPVARYWPEFAAQGKETVKVKHVMSHSTGLSGFEPALGSIDELYDRKAIAERLAAMTPWWDPGEGSGYHAVTQGQLQGEIVERITGKTLGTWFREEIAEPLGADFHIGLDPAHDARVGELVPPESGLATPPGGRESIAARTMRSCPITGLEPRTEAWRRAEIPAAGGIGNARAVARIHSMMACGGEVDGVRILSEAGALRALEEQTNGPDQVLILPIRFGLGFGLVSETFPLSPNPRSCFWGGWGGSLAMIDFDARISASYAMNKMEGNLAGDARGGSVLLSVYKALGS